MWKGANGDGMTKSDCFRLKASGSRGGEGERSAAESSVVSWLRLDAIKIFLVVFLPFDSLPSGCTVDNRSGRCLEALPHHPCPGWLWSRCPP
ncbi:hypothetical protein C4D60_Mb06t24710 [Musa balbisiana]|uniref:Uncharacterized protein n=1 Tax=Musa balbisiana TaxID=52838 RepID=A0A4S8IQF3_MUSBA|nr:hypothetical protein C4D60_Mb06t24710 [Musa balbisiana]